MNETTTNNTTPNSPGEPMFVCYLYVIISVGVVVNTLCLFSFVGNPLSFIVWWKIGKRKKFNASIVLMMGLAISDVITLIPPKW